MSDSLSPQEELLLSYVEDGEVGLANYGEEVLRDKVLFHQGNGYMWSLQARLWTQANSATLRRSFVADTSNETKS